MAFDILASSTLPLVIADFSQTRTSTNLTSNTSTTLPTTSAGGSSSARYPASERFHGDNYLSVRWMGFDAKLSVDAAANLPMSRSLSFAADRRRTIQPLQQQVKEGRAGQLLSPPATAVRFPRMTTSSSTAEPNASNASKFHGGGGLRGGHDSAAADDVFDLSPEMVRRSCSLPTFLRKMSDLSSRSRGVSDGNPDGSSPSEFVTRPYKDPGILDIRVDFVRNGTHPKQQWVMPKDHDFRGYPPIESLGLPEFITAYERDPFNIRFLTEHRQTIFLKPSDAEVEPAEEEQPTGLAVLTAAAAVPVASSPTAVDSQRQQIVSQRSPRLLPLRSH